MTTRTGALVGRVAKVLAQHGHGLEEASWGRWKLELRNGRAVSARAWVEEPWLTLETDIPDNGSPPDPWALLRNAHGSSGGTRIVLAGHGIELRNRTEIHLGCAPDVHERVSRACHELLATGDKGSRGHIDSDPATAEGASRSGAEPWLDALRAEGWAWEERDDGSLSVPLHDTGLGLRAAAESHLGGTGLSLTTEIVGAPDLTPRSRRALGLLVLQGAGRVRMVGGVTGERNGRDWAGFSVGLPPDATPGEVDHALSALSLAASSMAREARALIDPDVARRYLELRE
jgi:hypothetical protein